jgi:prepilin-type N-terminal cleavage/methylation domain-containing protein
MKMLKKRNQKGFTLIEIIAVLVILGILAAVAIPKYFDLQSQAQQKALDGALAEGGARISSYFGSSVLGGTATTSIAYGTVAGTAGDFTLAYSGADAAGSASGAAITITATGIAGSAVAGQSKSRTVPRP